MADVNDQNGAVLVLRADTRSLPLPDASVDLIVTSPPYFGQRTYTDGGNPLPGQIGAEATPREYVAALLECTQEWTRVLKPEGSLFVNLGDKYSGYTNGQGKGRNLGGGKRGAPLVPDGPVSAPAVYGVPNKSLMALPWRYALGCADELGLLLRAEILWRKIHPMPESVTDRVQRVHEQVFHFTRRARYFASVDEVRDREGKVPGSVWDIATHALRVPAHLGVRHCAAFPPQLPARIILGWSPPGGVVLDPFGGTGTTALAASVLGRTGISADLSADYCRVARWRVSDPAQRLGALAKR